MQGECTLSRLKLDLTGKAEQSITVQAPDNFVDEGTNIISYICNISHTLSSTDTNYNSKVYVTRVSVVDDDVADVKVAAYSPESNTFLANVNELGPLCLDEGKNITYGIVLESQPVNIVIIGAISTWSFTRSDGALNVPVREPLAHNVIAMFVAV